MLNIVVPMAGAGSRFTKAGYELPKPLIPVHDIPMVRLVIENIRPQREHRFIFIVQSAHDAKYGLTQQLKQWASENAVVVRVDELTAGAACTVLAAEHFINTSDPLMIANSDQWIDMSIEDYLRAAEGFQDGSIMTMDANDPKWSFVETAADGHVLRVVEKEVISSTATVGIYNFARGSDFVSAAKEMVEANERVNGEFYVAPVYNRLIRTGAQVGTFSIGSEANGMYGLGIPADLELFLNLPVCGKALAPFQASRPAQ